MVFAATNGRESLDNPALYWGRDTMMSGPEVFPAHVDTSATTSRPMPVSFKHNNRPLGINGSQSVGLPCGLLELQRNLMTFLRFASTLTLLVNLHSAEKADYNELNFFMICIYTTEMSVRKLQIQQKKYWTAFSKKKPAWLQCFQNRATTFFSFKNTKYMYCMKIYRITSLQN